MGLDQDFIVSTKTPDGAEHTKVLQDYRNRHILHNLMLEHVAVNKDEAVNHEVTREKLMLLKEAASTENFVKEDQLRYGPPLNETLDILAGQMAKGAKIYYWFG